MFSTKENITAAVKMSLALVPASTTLCVRGKNHKRNLNDRFVQERAAIKPNKANMEQNTSAVHCSSLCLCIFQSLSLGFYSFFWY